MYRDYEDPRVLEKQVDHLKKQYLLCEDPTERLFIEEDLYEMKQRAIWAWMDEEADEEGW